MDKDSRKRLNDQRMKRSLEELKRLRRENKYEVTSKQAVKN